MSEKLTEDIALLNFYYHRCFYFWLLTIIHLSVWCQHKQSHFQVFNYGHYLSFQSAATSHSHVMLCIQICGYNILTISNINPTSNSCHGQPQPASLVLLKIYKNILGIENI